MLSVLLTNGCQSNLLQNVDLNIMQSIHKQGEQQEMLYWNTFLWSAIYIECLPMQDEPHLGNYFVSKWIGVMEVDLWQPPSRRLMPVQGLFCIALQSELFLEREESSVMSWMDYNMFRLLKLICFQAGCVNVFIDRLSWKIRKYSIMSTKQTKPAHSHVYKAVMHQGFNWEAI